MRLLAITAPEAVPIDAQRRCRKSVPHARRGRRPRRGAMRRYPRAGLLRRVFEVVEVVVCPHCGGERRLLVAITKPDSIGRVLRAMGLAHKLPALAPASSGGAECWRRDVVGVGCGRWFAVRAGAALTSRFRKECPRSGRQNSGLAMPRPSVKRRVR